MIALCTALAVAQGAGANETADLRKKAEVLRNDGNWKEALEIHRALLRESSDERSGQDLHRALEELQRINRTAEWDDLVEGAVERHAGNWRVLEAAAGAYRDAPHWGFLIDGEFQRGHSRGGGRHVASQERDRVRAIQLALEAIE